MRKLILLFLAGIVVMLLSLSLFGIGEVLSIVASCNPFLLLLAIAVQFLIIVLYALRFRIVASKSKKMPLRDTFFITIVGNFMDLITPIAKVGGQPVMIYLAKKKIGSAKSSAIVMMDTIIDVFSSIILVAAVLIVFNWSIPYQLLLPLFIFVVITFALIAGFFKLFLSKKMLARLLKWTTTKVRRFRKIDAMFHARLFERSFRLMLDDRKIMSKSMLLSFAIKFLELLRIWIVFRAIGISLSPQDLLMVWSFMLLLLAVPWLPGSLGLMEFGIASAFVILGLSASAAAAGVLLDRFVSFWFVMAFSLVVIWLSRYKVRELVKVSGKKK
jgi:glycosyltransferase 2 family protein